MAGLGIELPKSRSVTVTDSTGQVSQIDASDLAAAQEEDSGLRLATAKEVKHAKDQAEYGTGLLTDLEAGAAGLLRGATLGATDYAARKFAPKLANQLAYLKEEAPIWSGGGEVAGMIAPMLLSGGSGAAAKGVGALGTAGKAVRAVGMPARRLAAAGDLAERGIASLVGSGAENFGLRALQKGAAIGARGAVEGGLLGMANEISEASLGDREITAERLRASLGHGALLGGLVGGGLGVGAELVATGTRKLAGKVLEHVNPEAMENRAGELTFQGLGPTQRMVDNANEFAGGAGGVGRTLNEELPKFSEQALGRKVDSIGGFGNRADVNKVMSFGKKSINREIGDFLGEGDSYLAQRAPKVAGSAVESAPIAALTDEEQKLVQYASSNASHVGEVNSIMRAENPKLFESIIKKQKATMAIEDGLAAEEGKLVSKLSDVAEKRGVQPLASDVVKNLRDKVAPKFENMIMGETQAAAVDKFLNSLLKQAGGPDGAMTLRQMKDASVKASKLAGAWKRDPSGLGEVYQDIRTAIEGELKSQLGLVAEASGKTSLVADYEKLMQRSQAFILGEKAIKRGVAQVGANNKLGLIDSILTAGGTGAGAMIAGAPGAMAGGAIAGLGSKYVRQRFDFVAADALQRVAKMQALAKLSMDFDKGVEGAISSMLTKHTPEPAVSAASQLWGTGKKRTENVEKTIGRVIQLSQNPSATSNMIANRLGGLARVAPDTTVAAASQTANALQYLNANLPQSKAQASMFNPTPKPIYSDADITKFANILQAVDNPLKAIDDLKRGQLQPETVEAVKAVYPKVFADMQNKIMQQSLTLQKSLPYDKQIQLGMMFDVPVNPTMQPDFVSVIQEGFNSQQAPQKSGGLPPVAESKAIQNQYSTEADKLEGAP